ncbi:MAG TPA: dihydrolipoamide acetyltransferase family protein [Rhodanobacteraceae bacterium]|nr:dihydrolipoamide acetyltransferase family protein [Rhodanobacteraceae bacterium]
MAENKTFHLPDLGEGLPDATIVEWLVKEGDSVKLDAPLISMETAKAVVEVPSPFTGKLLKQHGVAGDVINTGAPLAEFELDPKGKQRAENAAGSHHVEPVAASAPAPAAPPAAERADEGTVVGAVASSNEVRREHVGSVGGVKAVPAVRAMARKLKVDLARVRATGADGVVTMQDVKHAATAGTAPLAAATGRGGKGSASSVPSSVLRSPVPGGRREEQRSTLSHAGRPIRTTPPNISVTGQPEQLKGVRRNMARVMAQANVEVAQTTIVDDADLHQWLGKQDITVRTIRAIVAACKVEPSLNAWFDGKNLTITRHPNVDLGIAVDTPDGLFVPALRNADVLDARGLREGINRLRAQVEDRSIPASELTGYTISLSNFGMFAGRYGTVVVVPPCVAIVGVGKLSHDVVAVMGGIEVHRRLPISLTFDHRACTGGEAARFLKALLDDLALPQ